MILGRVVGSVWGRKEAERLRQAKLLRIRPVDFPADAEGPVEVVADGPDVPLKENVIVAVDMLGAGVGEYVLVGHGSRIRDITVGRDMPTKEVVLAIVDRAVVYPELYPEKER